MDTCHQLSGHLVFDMGYSVTTFNYEVIWSKPKQ